MSTSKLCCGFDHIFDYPFWIVFGREIYYQFKIEQAAIMVSLLTALINVSVAMKMGREIVIVLQLSATYVEITKLRSCEDKYECS